MSKYPKVDLSAENLRKYWEGKTNFFNRYYIYLQRGLGLFNEIKNYLMLLFGTYWTVKTMDYWVNLGFSDVTLTIGLGIAAMVGVGFLILMGRWEMMKLSKSREFINQQKASITGYNSYNLSIDQYDILEEIRDLLKKNNPGQ